MRSQVMDAISRLSSQSGDEDASSSSPSSDSDQSKIPTNSSTDAASAATQQQAKPTLKIADLLGLNQNLLNTGSDASGAVDSAATADSSAKALASFSKSRASVAPSAATALSKTNAAAKATPRVSHPNSEPKPQDLAQTNGSDPASQPLPPIQLSRKDSDRGDDLSSAVTGSKQQRGSAAAESSKVDSESVSLDSANPAFDMKITADGAAPNGHSSSTVQGPSIASPAAVLQQTPAVKADVATSGSADHDPAHAPEQGLIVESTGESGLGGVSADASTAGQATAAPQATEIDTVNPGSQGEPVRNVHMQLSGDNNQRVDVRVFDQGGELRVNVKASDPTLARNLQEHIPDLTGRLAQERFKAEVWTPTAGAFQTSETNNNQSFQQNQDGNNTQQGRQQRDNSNENQPNWWLESDD